MIYNLYIIYVYMYKPILPTRAHRARLLRRYLLAIVVGGALLCGIVVE